MRILIGNTLAGDPALSFFDSLFSCSDNSVYPPTDIYEAEDGLHVEMGLSGFAKEDLDVQVKNNVLSISGKRNAKDVKFFARERHNKSFTRSWALSDDMDTTGVDASFKDGLLALLIPKKPETGQTKIEIK